MVRQCAYVHGRGYLILLIDEEDTRWRTQHPYQLLTMNHLQHSLWNALTHSRTSLEPCLNSSNTWWIASTKTLVFLLQDISQKKEKLNLNCPDQKYGRVFKKHAQDNKLHLFSSILHLVLNLFTKFWTITSQWISSSNPGGNPTSVAPSWLPTYPFNKESNHP